MRRVTVLAGALASAAIWAESSLTVTGPNKVWIWSLGSGNMSSYTNDSARHLWAVRGGN